MSLSPIPDSVLSAIKGNLPNTKQDSIGNIVKKFKEELATTPSRFAFSALLQSTSNTISRLPWIITCDSWVREGTNKSSDKYIVMQPNPKTIKWTIPFRKSMVKTAAGMVSFSWRDPSRGYTVFDEPILEMTMQSGSLLPVMSFEGQAKEQLLASTSRIMPDVIGKARFEESMRTKFVKKTFVQSKAIDIFYSFLGLYNAPQINPYTGEPNYIRLVMNTMLFPKLIVRGQFVAEDALEWEESSTDPNQIEWPVKLVISKLTPNIGIDNFKELLSVWKASGGSDGFKVPPNEELQKQLIEKDIDKDEEDWLLRQEEDEAIANELRQKETPEQKQKKDAQETQEDKVKETIIKDEVGRGMLVAERPTESIPKEGTGTFESQMAGPLNAAIQARKG